MPTAADFEPELVEALNLLIEDERASVEMEVALASGATEYTERDTLARMGADDIHTCEALRVEMESAGLEVTLQINGVVFEVLGAERYDDRLRSFAHHQRIVADRANDLLESNLDGELRVALESIVETHQRHIEWASERADTFAATRLLEFGPRPAAPPLPTPATKTPEPEAMAPEESATPTETLAIDDALPAIVPTGEIEFAPEAAPVVAPQAAPVVSEAAPVTPPRKRATRAATPRASKTSKASKASKASKTSAASPAPSTPRPRATRARKPTPPASAE